MSQLQFIVSSECDSEQLTHPSLCFMSLLKKPETTTPYSTMESERTRQLQTSHFGRLIAKLGSRDGEAAGDGLSSRICFVPRQR